MPVAYGFNLSQQTFLMKFPGQATPVYPSTAMTMSTQPNPQVGFMLEQ
jgi:hypothetical protein